MIVTREQYEAAYKVGLRRHDGEIDNADVKRLLADTGMKESTASILAGNVSYMLKGEVYKRAQSIPAMDDYLTWIRRDRDISEYKNAIRSLRAHIEYYESTHKGPRKEPWEILAKHEALAEIPAESAILLEYTEVFSRGYVDILPLGLFADEGTTKGVVHIVRSKGGKNYQAKCDVTVGGFVANLDYEPYAAFNEEQGMYLGIARITFEDSDRTSIWLVEWKPAESDEYDECEFGSPAFIVPPAPPYRPPVNPAEKTLRPVRERPGQARFRRDLKSVYDNRCCISGCPVSEVLQAAHIDGYLSETSDNIRNGLLLRSDLHALFDSDMIGIDPSTLQIHVTEQAGGASGYADLHGVLLKLPTDTSHHPDLGALKRRWEKFSKSP